MFNLMVMLVAGNGFDEGSCCSIALSFINMSQLHRIEFDDKTPADCIRSGHWQRAGLVKPPDEVVRQGWKPVIEYMQVYAVFARAVGICRARDAFCATEPRCSFPHHLCRRTAPPCSACRVR